MRLINVALLLGTVGVSAAMAQQTPPDSVSALPRVDLSVDYTHINANAPPGDCNCFGLNGGSVAAGYNLNHWLALEGQFTGSHANNISLLGQDLTLLTFMGGPRVSITHHRLVPFGEVLFGGAHGSDSYFPSATSSSSSASSFAFSTGGGLDVNLTRRFAIRPLEVQYLRTTLPNGTNNAQNHLMIGGGLVIRFGKRYKTPVAAAPPTPKELALDCTTNVSNLDQGQVLQIVGHVANMADSPDVKYSWSSDAGTIEGEGSRVSLKTNRMAAGDYRVTGHATLISKPAMTAECSAPFRVNAPAPTPSPAPVTAPPAESAVPESAKHEEASSDNIPDILFDYNSYQMKPGQGLIINQAASYLMGHPDLHVVVGGYTDPRGSSTYNLRLGGKRASTVRGALIGDGAAANSIQITTHGKNDQVCTSQDESCWSQDRRATFTFHP